MQTLNTEAAAAFSPAGMSDLFFIPELMTAAASARDLTSHTPAEAARETLDFRISTSPAQDDDEKDDDIDDDDDDLDEDDDDDEEDEDDDDLGDDDEDDLDDEDEVDEEEEP